MDIALNTLLDMYYYMKLSRTIEHSLEILYKQGAIPSAIYPGIGQEASYVGSTLALKNGDVITTTHRDLAALLVRGITPKEIMAQHFAKTGSPTKGRSEDNYMGNLKLGIFTGLSPIPDMYPVAVGAAQAFVYKGEKNVAMTFSGEGATSKGDFHEALNWAKLFNLPVVFIVINNQFAYSTPNNLEMPTANVADRAKGYDIEGLVVDGNDVIKSYKSTKQAIDKARGGGGPTLIEMKTMRMKGHAGHDSANYVPKELFEKWSKKDPIKNFEKYLLENGSMNNELKTEFDTEIQEQVEEAILFAKQSPYPNPKNQTTGVYSD